VDALADIDLDLGRSSIGFFLEVEGFDVPVAILVGLVDDPGFLRLALAGRPRALAD
jgi:hypothetical protein